MSFATPIPSPPERKQAELDKDRSALQESIREVLRIFFMNAQAAFQNETCINCGSNNDLVEAKVSLSESGETWTISLPLCEICVSKESGRAVSEKFLQ